MVSILSRPQCVNSLWPSDTIGYHLIVNRLSLVQVEACYWIVTKPLAEFWPSDAIR